MTEATKIQDDIIGVSEHMEDVRRQIMVVAETDVPVQIIGPTGSGKELIAKHVHYKSSRNKEPFVPVNCSAIVESLAESTLFGHEKGSFSDAISLHKGYFEQANRGTLFLDEIGDMPLKIQPKLLRAIEEKKVTRVGSESPFDVNVRIIAATNKDLLKLIESNSFRDELYRRLEGEFIYTEPLAKTPEDVVCLVRHFMREEGLKASTKVAKMKFLLYSYDFPGNVRELKMLIKEGGNYERVKKKLQRDNPQLMGRFDWALEGLSPNQIKDSVEAYEIIIPLLYTNLSQRDLAKRLGMNRDCMQPGYFKKRFNFELPPRDERSPLWSHPMRLCEDFLAYMGHKKAIDKAESK
jgi:transcriptional regulator with GAF, ATPase, and Fis domain